MTQNKMMMTTTKTKTTSTTTKTKQNVAGAKTQLLLLLLGALVAAVEAAPSQQPESARLTSGLRFRRHASISHDSALLEQGDEQALRRHLPDLIAQAHNDKQAERALLRMLIQAASLRSNANSMAAAATGSWQLDGSAGEGNNLAQYNQANSGSVGEFVPTRSVRLFAPAQQQQQQQQLQPDAGSTSSLGDLAADLEAQLANSAADLTGNVAESNGQQSYTSLDKREYIKPCSFNAISCVRTPFGRRIK